MRNIKGLLLLIFFVAILSACGAPNSLRVNTPVDLATNQEDHGFEIYTNARFEKKTFTEREQQLLPPEFKRIYERGTLIVSMYAEDRYPYFFVDSKGNLVGSDVDLAYDIASKLGVAVQFDRSATTFDEVVNNVAEGKADVAISKLSITLDRATKVNYSTPYLMLHQTLLINRLQLAEMSGDSEGPFKAIMNRTVKIGVKEGTSYVGFAKEVFPKAKVVEYKNQDNIMDAAFRGDVFAAFYDENEVMSYMNNNPDKAIHLQVFTLEERVDPIAMAVAAENQHLLAWINQYLMMYNPQINKEEGPIYDNERDTKTSQNP